MCYAEPMKPNYSDILTRIDEPPVWWTEGGVPRWADMHPLEVGGYTCKVVFMRIACQSCGEQFIVSLSEHMYDKHRGVPPLEQRLASYGDVPSNKCCAVGDTMTSYPVRIESMWVDERGDWRKLDADELPPIPDGWWNHREEEYEQDPEIEALFD